MRKRNPSDYELFLVKLTEHLAAKKLNTDPTALAQAFVSLTQQYQSLQETECNRELTNLERNKEKRLTQQLEELGYMCILPLKFGSDPRGYAVKCFLSDGSYNTWGGAEEGYGIPSDFNS